ncbi:MAG: EAL domain-containing protein, partial [Pseudomonadota bacterium]
VNVSTFQIESDDFIETLRAVLAETGIAASRLELEVTESVLIRDHARMRRIFNDIKQLGVSIAIDDFGTGYSNLTNLSELAFDKIKIDKSFIQRLGQSSDSGSMISTIINLAQTLGATTVAEGIETEAQSELLAKAGCAVMQGFFHGRPQPRDAFIYDAMAKIA